MKYLIAFEEDKIDLVHQIRFRKVKSNFQRKLKTSNKALTPAGKTSNMYKLTKDEHNHLLDNCNIEKSNERNRGYYKQRRH